MLLKWVRFGVSLLFWGGALLGFVATALYLINSDLVRMLIPVRTAIPLALAAGSLLTGIKTLVARIVTVKNRQHLWLGRCLSIILLVSATVVYAGERPQYLEQEFSFSNGDTKFSGTLYLPDEEARHPAVVIIHGSLCAPRSLYHPWAENLVEHGVATLSFDKRGTGNSGGDCEGVRDNSSAENLQLLASDIISALDALKRRSSIDSTRLGLWSVSQGGWVAVIVASQFKDLKCMASVSGPSVSVGEEGYYSDLTEDGHGKEISDSMLAEIIQSVATVSPSGFDPRPLLSEISIPSLWVHGGHDLSIPVKKCTSVLDSLITIGRPFEYRIYPDAEHALIEMTFPIKFSTGANDFVAEWLLNQLTK